MLWWGEGGGYNGGGKWSGEGSKGGLYNGGGKCSILKMFIYE